MSIQTPTLDSPRFSQEEEDDIDSTCSTPFVSAPSSPCHVTPSGYFFSAPTSPTHFHNDNNNNNSFEFEFSSRFSHSNELVSMTSADELFFNGQIRPIKLSSHLQKPQEQDLEPLNVRGREFTSPRVGHRKARSMSPFRSWNQTATKENDVIVSESIETTPSCSASSSRSSSSGRNSKKWIFLKDLLHRSKSEGRANNKERFWSFTPKMGSPVITLRGEKKGKEKKVFGKPANGVGKMKGPVSAHELHYTANRAQAEEMKKKTFLPYRQGLFGCLGFSSKSYGTFSGLTKNFNPMSSR